MSKPSKVLAYKVWRCTLCNSYLEVDWNGMAQHLKDKHNLDTFVFAELQKGGDTIKELDIYE